MILYATAPPRSANQTKPPQEREEISQVFPVYPILGVPNFLLGDTVLAEYKDYTVFQFAFMQYVKQHACSQCDNSSRIAYGITVQQV